MEFEEALKSMKFRRQSVLEIIDDIAFHLENAELKSGMAEESIFARAAINNASLLGECIANSCIYSLQLQKQLFNEIDRLPTIAKFDYYLFATKNIHIDRSLHNAELFSGVLSLRDVIVHPKPRPGKAEITNSEISINYGAIKSLKISLDQRSWNVKSGKSVVKAVLDFIRNFFVDLCCYNKGQVTAMLGSTESSMANPEFNMWAHISQQQYDRYNRYIPICFEFLNLKV
jgi:hypothetical protein